MKFTIRKDIFSDNLNIVSKAVSGRTTMPILQCVLIRAFEDGCSLIGNDLEMGIETAPIEADVEQEGSIALEAKILMEIVRKMPGDFITVSSDPNNITTLSSGKSEFKILGQAQDEFPFPPKVEGERSFGISAAAFKDMIRQTIFSVALDEKKPVMTGELIELKDDSLHLVSVDGFRISYRRADDIEGLSSGERQKVVVPAKSLSELSRILPSDGDEKLFFRFSDRHISFAMKKYTLVSRLIDGEFLRYELIFNEDYKTIVNVGRANLLASLDRACLIASSVKVSPVKLNISIEKIVITSSTEMGTSYEEIEADVDGVNLEIGFNPRFLMDALKAVDEDVVTIKFNGQMSPCIIKSDENEKFKYLVLPLRTKS